MSEFFNPDDTDERQRALRNAQEFVENEIPTLSRLTGLEVNVAIGSGWKTNLQSGNFTVDPSFFIERDYSPEHSAYATLHELWAHVRDVKRDPQLAARQRRFVSHSKSNHIFNNFMADIHGNKLMHRILPAMNEVAADMYENKLFSLTDQDGQPIDYSLIPKHMQFLYKMMRDEMIPDSETPVCDEVRAAIDNLRDYEGAGDVIKYLTAPNSKLSGTDRFEQQLAIIYPVYQQLLEQDKQDDQDDSEESEEPGESSEGSDADPNKSQEPGDNDDSESGKTKSASESQNNIFENAYKDYFDNQHPEPLSDEEHKKLDEAIKKSVKENQQPINPHRELDKRLRQETGFSLKDHRQYRDEIAKHRDTIDRMRNVFRSIVNERIAIRRGLSRRSYSDGVILDPDRLAQTIIDIKSGVPDPEAFKQHETRRNHNQMVGNTDYLFAFDISGSMNGNRAHASATSALILLEGLAGVERDIKDLEQQHNIEIDIDVKTGLYVFGTETECVKPLGEELSDKERLETQQKILAADGGGTNDYNALETIAAMPRDSDRQRIVIVISDGGSSNAPRAKAAIDHLRSQGTYVYCVGIESNEATTLYRPHAQIVRNPDKLPDILESFITSTIY